MKKLAKAILPYVALLVLPLAIPCVSAYGKSAFTKRDRALRNHHNIGVASWYGRGFHGRKTASGKHFNMHEYTAAHKSLPLGTRVRVTNLKNGKDVIVNISDRGPYVKGRTIDLSYAAARSIGMIENGLARVRVEVISLPRG